MDETKCDESQHLADELIRNITPLLQSCITNENKDEIENHLKYFIREYRTLKAQEYSYTRGALNGFSGNKEIGEANYRPSTEEPLNPLFVRQSITRVADILQSGYGGNPRRTPTRLEKIWKFFRGHENRIVFLDELESEFDTKNPRQDAVSTISQINKQLEALDIDLALKKATVYFFSTI